MVSTCARTCFSISQKSQIMRPTHSPMDHITKTIRIMKKNNSSDTYGLSVWKLTCCSTELFIFFWTCVTTCWRQTVWRRSASAPYSRCSPKKKTQKPNSWRPIALLDVAYKVIRYLLKSCEREHEEFWTQNYRCTKSVSNAVLVWNLPRSFLRM